MAVVVITGASSGIGEATAKALAARGHSLTLAARRLDRLQQLVRETGAADRILIVPADVAEPAALKAVADAAGERFGHIDVWINNAGVSYPDRTPWWELPAERVDNIVRVNFTAPILSVGAALPWLKKSKNSADHQYRLSIGLCRRQRHLFRDKIRHTRPHRSDAARACSRRHQHVDGIAGLCAYRIDG